MTEHADRKDIAALTEMRLAYLKEDLGAMDEATERRYGQNCRPILNAI